MLDHWAQGITTSALKNLHASHVRWVHVHPIPGLRSIGHRNIWLKTTTILERLRLLPLLLRNEFSNEGFLEWNKNTWNSSISQAFFGPFSAWWNRSSKHRQLIERDVSLNAICDKNPGCCLRRVIQIWIFYYLILWSWYIIMLLLDKYEAIIWSHIEKRAENEGSLYRNLGFWWLIVCKLGHG